MKHWQKVLSKKLMPKKQMDHEQRVKNAGGVYIKDKHGDLVKIPNSVRTRIERRD
ncbi:MAG: hypothetical protein IJ192_05855 [Clostridia bacterium]|nr:hypothetical protein [Clostridia bacterium]